MAEHKLVTTLTKMDIDNLTDAQVIEQYRSDLTEMFRVDEDRAIETVLEDAYGYGNEQFSADYALLQFDEYASQAVQIQSFSETNPELADEARVLMSKIQSSYNILIDLLNFKGGSHSFTMSAEEHILRFTPIDDDAKPKSIQIVFKYVLQWCKRLNLRHDGKSVYSEKINDKGQKTSAWQQATSVGGIDLSEFSKLIAYVCQKKHSAAVFDHWILVSAESVANLLKNSMEIEFRQLKQCRHWISFADGLYHTPTDTFIEYDQRQQYGVPTDLTTAVYHDVYFKAVYQPTNNGPILDPLLEIKTPTLDHIFSTQHFSKCTQFLIMAFLGRLLYWTETFEAWQIAVYFKGLAGEWEHCNVCMIQ